MITVLVDCSRIARQSSSDILALLTVTLTRPDLESLPISDDNGVIRSNQVTTLLERIAAAELSDHAWPERVWDLYREFAVLKWVIPQEFGGAAISSAELTHGYLRLAAADLTSTFVLTQRNGACQRLAGSSNEELKAELLPKLCRGDVFATVGISHLTTSGQHLKNPAVQLTEVDGDFVLDGRIPWVTGANHADWILVGATMGDGKQALLMLPTELDGVTIEPPPNLLALTGSQTGAVGLKQVRLSHRHLVGGPIENVMKSGAGGGTGSLTTSALAMGHAAGLLNRLADEAERRQDLIESYQVLQHAHQELLGNLVERAMDPESNEPQLSNEFIRQNANSLVLRTAQAYLAAVKGAGFLSGHPAERGVREAMFFLVWSCPQPVLNAQIREFACGLQSED
ncbi:acyl-CoA dehydrogenase family protein [Thalassoroseus pseudoceratinae]|uniref:acyl-CoA dehydrogenase family protein n=1 Tax=Thalassoroseus pseudoceratinae TaxID=2713176 RepID=UPI001420ABC0|nr:acyl-CoA dehydrogenase family protein [Thalassoroseus pseudoceratinae]